MHGGCRLAYSKFAILLESHVQEKGVKKWVSFEKFSRKFSRKSKGIKKLMSLEINSRKSSAPTEGLLPLDFGISCPGEGDPKMSEFRKNLSKIFRSYLSPSTLESHVKEKGAKNWVSYEKISRKISRKSSVPTIPSTLESHVQEKGVKKWVSFENISRKISRKSLVPTSPHRLWNLVSRKN